MNRWSCTWFLLLLLFPGFAHAYELNELIEKAGNAASDEARLTVLDELQRLPGLSNEQKLEAQRLIEEIRRYLTSNDLSYFSRSVLDTDDYDFGIGVDSPLYPLTHLYRGRMLVWTTLEYGGYWSNADSRRNRLDLVRKSLEMAHDAFPKEPLARMYLGEPTPPTTTYSAVKEAPAWAVAQREGLERLTDIIYWWIDHRMQESGQYGGGWGDDCEMWRWWVPVLIGFSDPKINAAQERFSEALLNQKHMLGGYTNRVYDVEHTAEDSSDAMTPMLHLHPDGDQWKKRALRLVQLMKTLWAGENERGYFQFKSTYFSVDKVDESAKRACDTVYHPRALQPALLLWQRTQVPALTELFCNWMDTWVDAAARAERGKPAGVIPSAVHWPDGSIGGVGKNWWDPENHSRDPLYVFPSEMRQMTHTLLLTYHVTRNEKYLAPIRSMAALKLRYHQNLLTSDLTPGTEAWCAMKMGSLSSVLSKYRLLTGSKEFDALLQDNASPYAQFRFWNRETGLTLALEKTAKALQTNFSGYTREVRFTDRVLSFPKLFVINGIYPNANRSIYVPDTELLYSTVTGDPGIAGYFPLNAVRWLTEPRNMAALVTKSGTFSLEAKLFHFGETPRSMAAEFYLLQPGRYTVTFGGEQRLMEVLAPRTRLEFTLPAQKEIRLTIKRAESQ